MFANLIRGRRHCSQISSFLSRPVVLCCVLCMRFGGKSKGLVAEQSKSQIQRWKARGRRGREKKRKEKKTY